MEASKLARANEGVVTNEVLDDTYMQWAHDAHKNNPIRAIVREDLDNCTNHGATKVLVELHEQDSDLYHMAGVVPTHVLSTMADSDATKYIGKSLGHNPVGCTWNNMGRNSEYRCLKNSLMHQGKKMCTFCFGRSVITETIIVCKKTMMGTLILYRNFHEKKDIHQSASITFRFVLGDDDGCTVFFEDPEDDDNYLDQVRDIRNYIRCSLFYNSHDSSGSGEIRRARERICKWIKKVIGFCSFSDHGLITLYSSMSMMGVGGSMIYYNESGTDILFHNPERMTDTPVTSITTTTRGFFNVSCTPSNVDFVLTDGTKAETPSTKYFMRSRRGDEIDMMNSPGLHDGLQDIIVSTLNDCHTCSHLKLTTAKTSMPCAIEDIERFKGTSRSHTNDVRSGMRAVVAADVAIDFNPGKYIYKGTAGCMQTWLNRCMDPEGIKSSSAIRNDVMELGVGKTAPEIKFEGHSINYEVIDKIVKIALATYASAKSYAEKYACFKDDVGYSLHAVIYSVFKYAKWTSPKNIADMHKIPKVDQELNKTTARHRFHHICGGNVAMSINFTNFFPSVDKRNIANPDQRVFMIEGVKMICIIKAMLEQDESFKKDVVEYDRTDGACAEAYSSAHVIKLPSDVTLSVSPLSTPAAAAAAASAISRGGSGNPHMGDEAVHVGSTCNRKRKQNLKHPIHEDIAFVGSSGSEIKEEEDDDGLEVGQRVGAGLGKARRIGADRQNAHLAQRQSIESAPGNMLQFFGDMAYGNLPEWFKFPEDGLVVAAAKELHEGNNAFAMIHKPAQDSLRSITRHYPIAVTQIIEKVIATNGTAGISKTELENMVNVLLAASYSACWVRPKNDMLCWPNTMKPAKEAKKQAKDEGTSMAVGDITVVDEDEPEYFNEKPLQTKKKRPHEGTSIDVRDIRWTIGGRLVVDGTVVDEDEREYSPTKPLPSIQWKDDEDQQSSTNTEEDYTRPRNVVEIEE
tara:strand:+ start:557 stop:3463 length:2907 start_codon:yes stop_codon:yes gene_type:complete